MEVVSHVNEKQDSRRGISSRKVEVLEVTLRFISYSTKKIVSIRGKFHIAQRNWIQLHITFNMRFISQRI